MNIIRSDSLRSSDSMINESEIDVLKVELENEKSHRDNAHWRNNEIENSIIKLQEQLQKDDYEWEYDDEFNVALVRNKDLAAEVQDLKDQLPLLKERLKGAKVCGKECRMKHDSLNINLDLLSELELIKTTKRLERMRVDLRSALISKEWSLDSESKVYQRLLDQKVHLQNQLYHTNTMTARKELSTERWQNGGISKQYRTFDLKYGPIKQTVACEKLPKITKTVIKG